MLMGESAIVKAGSNLSFSKRAGARINSVREPEETHH